MRPSTPIADQAKKRARDPDTDEVVEVPQAKKAKASPKVAPPASPASQLSAQEYYARMKKKREEEAVGEGEAEEVAPSPSPALPNVKASPKSSKKGGGGGGGGGSGKGKGGKAVKDDKPARGRKRKADQDDGMLTQPMEGDMDFILTTTSMLESTNKKGT